MDKIHFKISRFRKAITIGIEINGRDFIDMVREIERPFASVFAGAYQGIFPWSNFDPVRYFLAEEDVFLDSNGKLAVLGCTCGEVECWPMMTRISVNQETVSWTNFEQPHRGPRAPKGHFAAFLQIIYIFSSVFGFDSLTSQLSSSIDENHNSTYFNRNSVVSPLPVIVE
jgi:hypothetical protein